MTLRDDIINELKALANRVYGDSQDTRPGPQVHGSTRQHGGCWNPKPTVSST